MAIARYLDEVTASVGRLVTEGVTLLSGELSTAPEQKEQVSDRRGKIVGEARQR